MECQILASWNYKTQSQKFAYKGWLLAGGLRKCTDVGQRAAEKGKQRSLLCQGRETCFWTTLNCDDLPSRPH